MVDQLDTFLRLLFPWEPEHLGLYKSIMWKFPQDPAAATKGPPLANYAAQDYDGLKRLISGRTSKPFHDVWICLGTQKICDTKLSRDGFFKAIRQLPNISSLKSIWLDIDVKADAYANTMEAATALYQFVQDVGLPMPTMIVKSGSGGMHVYWCTAENMDVDQWRVVATALRDAALDKGLKFDPQVTVNAAGVLRVPGSLNWKTGTPQPVQLVIPANGSFPVYKYDQLVRSLSAYVANIVIGKASVTSGGATIYTQNFTANVGGSVAPTTLADLTGVCPLTADTVARGGAGDPEPLWNMMMLLASFTDDPIASAHKMSRGDPRYTQAETDRKIQEKITSRANIPSLGWPSCASFAPLNPHCRTCQFSGQGKSPFNFVAKTNPQPGAPPQKGDTLVPEPYWRDVDNHVWRSFTDDKGESVSVDMIGHKVLDAFIDEVNNQMVFKTIIVGKEFWVQVPAGSCAQISTLIKVLGQAPSGGINIPASKHAKVRDFFVAWITHLQQQRRTIVPSSYGWSDDMKSFSFGDKTFTPNGPERAYLGRKFDPKFQEVGKLQPWQDCMKLVYGRPELEIVVASSFAAPLTAMLGSTSAVLSTYSAASGVGKSTAMKLAQAVWGNPTSGMSSLDDTVNAVKKKIADLKSLPAYWDELITADITEKVVNLVFSFTQGKAKSRLTQNSEQMEANAFVTLFAIASNHGVGSRLYADTNGTEAGGLRIFEVEAQPGAPTCSGHDADRMVGLLASNFGCAGMAYAEKLIGDRQTVEQVLDFVEKHLANICKFDQKERYWRTTMTVILSGAILANRNSLTTFDIPAMEAKLIAELQRQRGRLKAKAHVTMSSSTSVLELINELHSSLKGRNLITTETIPLVGGGRPSQIKLVDTDVTKLFDVWMQTGSLDGRIRVKADRFDRWCLEKKQNPDNILNLLRQHFYIQTGRYSIGAGVPMFDSTTVGITGRSTCYDLTPITSHSSNGST